MAIVSPSILSADFGKLGADCRMVLDAGAQMLHYDVMDGHFVPNISFGVPVLKSLHKALPDAFYDVHLMISHPLQYAEPFIKAGATLYNFHLECEDDIQATIDAVRALGCKVGLTIKPGTPAEALAPWLDQLDLVLVPCTAFDAGCYRVGMGKGYYDRYLPYCTRAARGTPTTSPLPPGAGTGRLPRRLHPFALRSLWGRSRPCRRGCRSCPAG